MMEPRDSQERLSAEPSEALMAHEKAWREPRTEAPRRSCCSRGWVAWRFIADAVTMTAILVLLAHQHADEAARERPAIGGEISGFAPHFAQQIVTFKPDPSYVPENATEFFTDEVHQKWLDLVPRGLGYVEVGGAWTYDNLPTPLPEYSPTAVFTTSVTHQLHCLHSIIESHSALASGRADAAATNAPWHLAHCFDYLRQAIMCSGDVALEGAQTTFPDGSPGSDGWDAKHVCRDYSQVYRYLTRKRANNKAWI